jgi:hypothetical protein
MKKMQEKFLHKKSPPFLTSFIRCIDAFGGYLSNLTSDRYRLCFVPFRVNLRHGQFGMTKQNLCCLQSELFSDVRGCQMP